MLIYNPGGDCACLYDPGIKGEIALTEHQQQLLAAASWICVTIGPKEVTEEVLKIVREDQKLAWIVKNDPNALTSDQAARLASRADVIFCNGRERAFLAEVKSDRKARNPGQWLIETQVSGARSSNSTESRPSCLPNRSACAIRRVPATASPVAFWPHSSMARAIRMSSPVVTWRPPTHCSPHARQKKKENRADTMKEEQTNRAWYIGAKREEVGEAAILVGDPARIARIAEHMTDVAFLPEQRGLKTVTGTRNGTRITATAFGMGAPIATIVLHELYALGIRTFLRIGTAMALPPAKLGDFVLADGALRAEGTSPSYAPLGFPRLPISTSTPSCAH